jgi:hypothetical protein
MTDPYFFETVDTLYHAALHLVPLGLRDSSELLAAGFGFTGGLGASVALQQFSRRVVDRFVPGFDRFPAPAIEFILMAAVVALPLSQAAGDPEGFRQLITEHPTYTAGMAFATAGGLVAGISDLAVRVDRDRRYLP